MSGTVQMPDPVWFVTLDRTEAELFDRYGPIDSRRGFYYVTVMYDHRRALLRGPFSTHVEAIRALPAAKTEAGKLDPRACWYAFGTARSDEHEGSGVLDRPTGSRP